MKNAKLFLLSALIFASAGMAEAKIEAVIGPVALKSNLNVAGFIPEVSDDEVIISRDQYVISYNKTRRSPNWVEWQLEAKDIGSTPRTDIFAVDPDLQKYLVDSGSKDTPVDPSEYLDSCFDRGHQIPSKDRSSNAKNNAQTFMMSNMLPQTAYLNRVIWEHLEQYTRDLVQKNNKKVFVIAGPVYDEDFGFIGPHHDIPVPSKNFKIILVLDANQTAADINPQTELIAVMMPNVFQDGSKPAAGHCLTETPARSYNTSDWEVYKTTVAEIQKVTGIKFTASIP